MSLRGCEAEVGLDAPPPSLRVPHIHPQHVQHVALELRGRSLTAHHPIVELPVVVGGIDEEVIGR